MSTRSILAVLTACVALSTGIGFAFGAASQPDSATAAKDSKIHKQIKSSIQSLSSQVADVQNRIGPIGTSSLVSRLQRIEADTTGIEGDTGRIEGDTGRIESDTGRIESDTGRIEGDTGRIESDTKHICSTLGTFC